MCKLFSKKQMFTEWEKQVCDRFKLYDRAGTRLRPVSAVGSDAKETSPSRSTLRLQARHWG